jgi:hypothetical protein
MRSRGLALKYRSVRPHPGAVAAAAGAFIFGEANVWEGPPGRSCNGSVAQRVALLRPVEDVYRRTPAGVQTITAGQKSVVEIDCYALPSNWA